MLRASGKTTEAARLERTELAEAWVAHRASGDATDVTPLLESEEARVADAVVLADILAPLLAARLADQDTVNVARAARSSKASSANRPDLGGSPGAPVPTVADFIEGMLAQDRAVSR